MHDRTIQKATSEGWTDLEVINGQVWGYRNPADVMPQPYEANFPRSSVSALILESIERVQRIPAPGLIESQMGLQYSFLRDRLGKIISSQSLEALAIEYHEQQKQHLRESVRRSIFTTLIIDDKPKNIIYP